MSWINRALVTAMPLVPRFLVARVASRYVAGETRQEALDTVRALNAQGSMATLDVLGEAVRRPEKADEAVAEYLGLIDAIKAQGLDANISVKPTMLGLEIDEALCRDNLARLAAAAAGHGIFLRIDMEDRTTTDATLRIYSELQEAHGNVGTVLQAYMRRTLKDIAELPEKSPNIRLCKGIYIEPEADAWKGFDSVRHNYLAALEKLIQRGVYPAIATHDEYLLCGATALVDRYGLAREQYEFQMLLGVRNDLRQIVVEQGHRMRVYVPYGPDWYPYSARRLRENPEVAGHILRATLTGK